MFRANFCLSSEAQDGGFFTTYGIVSCICGRQGFVTRCRAPNPCLPQQQDTIPYVVKKPQSCAPEDGQQFARNMLSWSWRSIELLLLHLVGFYITLPTLMMHGQTQIKEHNLLEL